MSFVILQTSYYSLSILFGNNKVQTERGVWFLYHHLLQEEEPIKLTDTPVSLLFLDIYCPKYTSMGSLMRFTHVNSAHMSVWNKIYYAALIYGTCVPHYVGDAFVSICLLYSQNLLALYISGFISLFIREIGSLWLDSRQSYLVFGMAE